MAKTRFDGRRSNYWDWNGKRTPEAEALLAERREKRKQRKEARAIPNIKLTADEARQRVSATSLSRELDLPVAQVKALMPKRTYRGVRAGGVRISEPKAKNSTTTLGYVVRKMNESKSSLTGLLKK